MGEGLVSNETEGKGWRDGDRQQGQGVTRHRAGQGRGPPTPLPVSLVMRVQAHSPGFGR